MKKPGKIAKSAENANLPRIPIKTQGFLLKPREKEGVVGGVWEARTGHGEAAWAGPPKLQRKHKHPKD